MSAQAEKLDEVCCEWPTDTLANCIEKTKVPAKVPRKQFLEDGPFPIISQEADFINGYWDQDADLVQVTEPVVVFGDHTQVLKLVDFDFVVGADGVKILKPKEFLNASFLKFFLEANPFPSLGYARHYRHISDLKIPLPPLEEQKRIVAKLDQAFTALDRARALAEVNLADAGKLFPTILGQAFSPEVPWDLKAISELVELGAMERPIDGNHGETHPKKADFVDTGVPFIMASDLKEGSVDQQSCYFITHAQAEGLRKGFAKNGDVLLSHKGTIGRAAILTTELDYVMLTPQVTYYRVIDDQLLDRDFLFFCLRSSEFQKQMTDIAGIGATRAYIGITRQLDLRIPVPDIETQKRLVSDFSKVEQTAESLVSKYSAQLADLADLRQSLLQKAFSGQL